MKTKILTIAGLLFISTSVFSQSFNDVIGSLNGNDANVYAQNFFNPAFKGLILNLGNGWYTTAKTHSTFGFDVTLNANLAFVPDNDKHFTFNPNDYENLTLESGSSELPTIMGGNSNSRLSVQVPINGNQTKVTSISAINGIEDDLPVSTSVIPTPMIQIGIGLPSNTDLKIRYIPSVGGKDVDLNLIGFGLQHDILQYFPVAKRLPLLDVSVLAAFTHSTLSYNRTNRQFPGENQITEMALNSYTFQAVSSINLKIVNFYLGAGYTTGNSTVKVKGNYNYSYDLTDNTGYVLKTITETITDPIDMKTNVKGLKATIGMRLNIVFFKIFADYTLQEYNTLNAGIAFSFR